VTQLCAQTSPALDPNYITLQPSETFKGLWANQRVGDVINNVGVMSPTSEYGDVFLNCIDTFGYGSDVEFKRPLGLFQGGQNFSLFNHAKLTFNNSFKFQKIYSRGKDSLPLIIADSNSLYRVHYPNEPYNYTLKEMPFLSYKNPSTNIVGNNWGLGAGYFNSDGFEDLIGIVESGDSTAIGIWHGEKLEYQGDTVRFGAVHYNIIPDNYILKVFGTSLGDPAHPILFIRDLNQDGIPDIIFLCDTLSEFGRHGGSKKIDVVFGKRDINGEWQVDTSLYLKTPFQLKGILLMDFLWSDGIPDLLLSSEDTIYCYSGTSKDFLRSQPDWLHPDLAIPSPAKLDPHNFNRDGNGGLDGWANQLFDAGNVNGSGDHSLATFADYYPIRGGLNLIGYAFLYSGGKAADEKADAIIANSESIYVGYTAFDTVQSSLTGSMNFLLGDFGNTAGATGRIDFVHGTSEIPHSPDPRWIKGVVNSSFQTTSKINLLENPVREIAHVNVESQGWQNGVLTVRDLLGRAILTKKVYEIGSQTMIDMNLTSLPDGVYIIQFSSKSTTVSTRCILIH